jgi:N-acetylglucosamine malate deacetylase 2
MCAPSSTPNWNGESLNGKDREVQLDFPPFAKTLILVAHPDDETVGCAGLLQRATKAVVVFAVDGAPPHYRFERRFGSLRNYSDLRYREAAAALAGIPQCSFRRLVRQDGSCFVDQHLFLEMPEAFLSLCRIAREFAPDLIVSHAFEGGHLDHDACHVLAKRAAIALGVQTLEFPLYWRTEQHGDRFQEFRDARGPEFLLELSERELEVKRCMLAEYESQRGLTSVFQPQVERFRPISVGSRTNAVWSYYPFENRRKPWKADCFFQKLTEFESLQTQEALDPNGMPKW